MSGNEKIQNPNAKLSFIERLAYGLGDYSGNLIYSSISSFLLVYYVSVLGVDAAVAASIMAVSKIFDGVSDLIMGRIVDKTHSKWGKARPWILRMCIPLAVCTVLMFTVPSALAGKVQIAYMFLTYNLVSTVFYTGLNVPYATLQGLMTTDQYERGLLGNFRMLLATAGTMTVNTFVMKLCTFFGGGDSNSQRGWTLTFIVLAVVFVLLNLVTFFFCQERVTDGTVSENGKAGKGPSVVECLKSLVVNKYWILMVIFLFCLYFMMSTFFGSAYYFAQYVLGDETVFAATSNALSMAQIVMMFITPFIMKKIGKRYTAMIGMAAASVAFVLTAVVGSNVNLVIACNILKGAAFGCGAATMFGLLQDAITYGSWLTGVQAMGMGNAASSFCMKVGSGIGTAALGWILAAGNFNADPTSASAIASINVSCIWVPLATCVIGVVCMLFFDLDKYYEKAVADLAEGKWKGSR
ncbi:MAG: glycoside-pentoside-hexuronide (GPH):cation symporter [Eubacteriales bacterium]|nr:glycoside-pentoside-hexuronide (GPH):cation symporter [Eubacteriales bacterium]